MRFINEYEFLSNFYNCDIEYEGIVYSSTEHAFQAAKTFDMDEKMMIKNCKSAMSAKKNGRKVTLRSDWETVKNGIMETVIRKKFEDPKLQELLIRTDKEKIVEDNTWHDKYWGVCVCKRCGGKGENVLGVILEKVREDLTLKNSQDA